MNRIYLYPKWLCTFIILLHALGMNAQTEFEYWFDDNYASSKTMALRISTGTISGELDTKILSQGFHTLCMRLRAPDGLYSPVSSSVFFKFAGEGNSKIEYWFDNDLTKMGSTPIDENSDIVQILDLDLSDVQKFPFGFHRLNMRVVSSNGNYSPIYGTNVMRLPQGLISQITYWLDNDYKNKRVVAGRISNGEITQLEASLDFSMVSSGMHRLMYRISAKGNETGVIYEVPILVTRRYNDQPDVTILREHHWLDEITNTSTLVSNPQSIITKSYILDPAYYEVGQHAFYVQYQNSAEVWSEVNVTYFYKEESSRLRIGMRPEDDVTGIEDVISNDATFQIYTLDGKQVETMQPGLNIIRYSDGKTKKVLVK